MTRNPDTIPSRGTVKPPTVAATRHDLETHYGGAAEKRHHDAAASHVHVVQRGEWLWTLAERYLGDGARWHEIAKANPGIDPNRLDVGQRLTIPAAGHRSTDRLHHQSEPDGHRVPTTSGEKVTVEAGDSLSTISEDLYGTQHQWPAIYRQNRAKISDPDLIDVGQQLQLPDRNHLAHTDHPIHHAHQNRPETDTRHAAEPSPDQRHPQPHSTAQPRTTPASSPERTVDPEPAAAPPTGPSAHTSDEPIVAGQANQPVAGAGAVPAEPTVPAGAQVGQNSPDSAVAAVSVGLLLAAGLITTINLRRRRQMRARRPGRRIPSPSPRAVQLEEAVKAQHQPLRVEQLDQVTRAIAAHCHKAGAELPALSAVRVADQRIDFLFSRPPPRIRRPDSRSPPTDSVWTMQSADLAAVLATPGLDEATPPYPALVHARPRR